jgi:hypothetical protein
MKLSEFVKLGKGILSFGKPLDDGFLTDIYNDVMRAPIAVHEAEARKRKIAESQNSNYRRKEELLKEETGKLVEVVREKFKLKKDERFVTVTDTDCMYPF